jgi:HK97 gp10 family phage protein
MSIRTKNTRIRNEDKILKQYESQLKQIIAASGQMVMNEAKQSVQSHGSSGRTYTKYNPKRIHTASAANKTPNSDTGYLASNIYLKVDADKMGCSIESRAAYSKYLEFGTSKMTERPFLQPALESKRKKIKAMFAKLKARAT